MFNDFLSGLFQGGGTPAPSSSAVPEWVLLDETLQVRWNAVEPPKPSQGPLQQDVAQANSPRLSVPPVTFESEPGHAVSTPPKVMFEGEPENIVAKTGGKALVGGEPVEKAYRLFRASGLSREQAAAVTGNLIWESNGRTTIKPNTVNPWDNAKNSPRHPHSIGIAQWNDRAHLLYAFAEKEGIELGDWRSALTTGKFRDAKYTQSVIDKIPVETQLRFVVDELGKTERRSLTRLSSAKDLDNANAAAIGYHRPAGYTWRNPWGGHGFSNRLGLARSVLSRFQD